MVHRELGFGDVLGWSILRLRCMMHFMHNRNSRDSGRAGQGFLWGMSAGSHPSAEDKGFSTP